ncbi:tripartite tricarboxylate transporter substrate binding protein [Salicibibacter kimchii]|uniref:Tripartite tricarboxylate transporter substrate binding protein n=1 Tax=Salicibibacter kimchii TaxID=2099786 RepID=A0A345BWF6_9BACI|nr:tripartite tricarboxylate transporter substrate-binding protein [Salicibibacter kimchii]AXF55287.1 tripartite tricarboxylate transporter substrate binding protein [Salicibibacter kimchii]
MKKLPVISSIALLIFAVGCSNEQSEESASGETDWEPDRNVELLAPSGAGGGWDTQARLIADVIGQEGLMEQNIGVENMEGGTGAVGMNHVATQNDPHNIFVSSATSIPTWLSDDTEYGMEDFTPITNHGADYGVIAVHADAEWDNLDDLFEDMEEDPSSVSVIGGNVPGGFDHIQFMQLVMETDVDVGDVQYAADNDDHGIPAVLSGSADVVTSKTSSGITEQVRGDNLKILAILSEERLEVDEMFEEVPTAVEQGYDVVSPNWRGVHGPGDMTDEEVQYYEEVFRNVAESEEFQEQIQQLGWEDQYMDSEEFASFLEEEEETYREVLEELGL